MSSEKLAIGIAGFSIIGGTFHRSPQGQPPARGGDGLRDPSPWLGEIDGSGPAPNFTHSEISKRIELRLLGFGPMPPLALSTGLPGSRRPALRAAGRMDTEEAGLANGKSGQKMVRVPKSFPVSDYTAYN